MLMQNELIEKQNDTELIKLLRASIVSYTRAKNGEIIITYIVILLAFAYPITYVIIGAEKDFNLVACSFLLSIFIIIFSGYFKGNTEKGAIYKEEFDTKLFNLPWKSTLKRPVYSEVSKFSVQYKGNEIKDWYSPSLSATIPHNISIAVLQHSNTSWDINLRTAFRNWLIGFIILYSMAILNLIFCLAQLQIWRY